MPQPDPRDLKSGSATERGRWEIRLVMILLVGFIVLGGLWVLVFGSPSRDRAAIDSSNTGPALVGRSAPPAPTPPRPHP